MLSCSAVPDCVHDTVKLAPYSLTPQPGFCGCRSQNFVLLCFLTFQPGNWSESPLLNPLTGNFCMPRCEEPWCVHVG